MTFSISLENQLLATKFYVPIASGHLISHPRLFLLSTFILKHLTAPLCNGVIQQNSSQQMLEQLEQANLFVVSLDSKG